jgi:hypothetical protein
MSHFTVLVIGENPEEQLAPYDENIEVDDYVEDVVTEDEKQNFMKFYTEEKKTISPSLSFDDAYDLKGDDWNGMRWQKDEDGQWYNHSTYNPISKWDWYSLGGRWSGYLKLKNNTEGTIGEPGVFDNVCEKGWVDQTKKCNVDFEFMRSQAGEQASKRYDAFYSIVKDRVVPIWDNIRKKYSENDIELARKEYRENSVVIDVENNEEFKSYFLFNDMAEFVESRADYIQSARNSAISTFAIVKDGKWYEKGKMGWWAIVHDEKNQDDWNKQFSELLDSLSDDTLLSVYDCHI